PPRRAGAGLAADDRSPRQTAGRGGWPRPRRGAVNSRAQKMLERPVSFVTATQKLADIKGYVSAGGWIRRDWGSGPTIALGWEALGRIFVNDGLLVQDTDRGTGKWHVRIDRLTEKELVSVEALWPPRT